MCGCQEKRNTKEHIEKLAKRYTEFTGEETEIVTTQIYPDGDPVYRFIPIVHDGATNYMPIEYQ